MAAVAVAMVVVVVDVAVAMVVVAVVTAVPVVVVGVAAVADAVTAVPVAVVVGAVPVAVAAVAVTAVPVAVAAVAAVAETVVAADPLQIEVNFVEQSLVFVALCYQPPGLVVFHLSVPPVRLFSSKTLQVSFLFGNFSLLQYSVPAAVGTVVAVAGIVVAIVLAEVVARPILFVHSLPPMMAFVQSSLQVFQH